METYHKIQTLFKRHLDGPYKGKMIRGDWTTPELKYLANNQWEFTEKVDGTNIRVELIRVEDSLVVKFGGRTNNARIPEPLLESLHKIFPEHPTKAYPSDREANILDWMRSHDLHGVTLHGEGYGPKIQGGGKYREDHSFVLFDVKIGDWWLDGENVKDVAHNLGIDVVPVIGYGTLQDAIDIVSDGITFNSHGTIRRWGAGGLQSRWGNFLAEGIVARPVVPMFDRMGNRIITKIKTVDFK